MHPHTTRCRNRGGDSRNIRHSENLKPLSPISAEEIQLELLNVVPQLMLMLMLMSVAAELSDTTVEK